MEAYITKASLYNENDSRAPYAKDKIRCYASQAPSDAFGLRVNTTLNYCAANQKVSDDGLMMGFIVGNTY